LKDKTEDLEGEKNQGARISDILRRRKVVSPQYLEIIRGGKVGVAVGGGGKGGLGESQSDPAVTTILCSKGS